MLQSRVVLCNTYGLTEVGRVVGGLADVPDLSQERDQLSGRPVVYARSSGQHVHVVEHVEQR